MPAGPESEAADRLVVTAATILPESDNNDLAALVAMVGEYNGFFKTETSLEAGNAVFTMALAAASAIRGAIVLARRHPDASSNEIVRLLGEGNAKLHADDKP